MLIVKWSETPAFQLNTADGHPALSVRMEGSCMIVKVWSDFSDDPLPLKAEIPAADSDSASPSCALVLRPWRIEFWVNGRLMDEEWPAGKLLLTSDTATDAAPNAPLPEGISVSFAEDHVPFAERAADFTTDCGISARADEDGLPDTVIGQLLSKNGENAAEGWKPSDPGVFVGDCMPFAGGPEEDGGERYHLLWLKDRHHHHSKWNRGAHQWAHMSTLDFKNWDLHPLAVSIDAPEEGSICTGSWLKRDDGVQLLYYTVRTVDGSPAPLLRSVSEDGYRFRRDPDFRLYLSERYHGPSARDPKIVRAEDGSYHMFVTTSLVPEGVGCLAHLISADGNQWEEAAPLYIAPDEDQPECSDSFTLNGWHYLIFSHHGRGQYRMSRTPFTFADRGTPDWICPEDPDIPCESVPKATVWHGRILFAGFTRIEGYAGTLTFREAWQGPDGQLRF